MIYLYAFLLAGFICFIGQIILDNTKLTPGHVTSVFTVLGVILAFFNVYPWLIEKCGGGASNMILNFGNTLFNGAKMGYINDGFLGLFTGLLKESSAILSATIIFSFILTIIYKPKN